MEPILGQAGGAQSPHVQNALQESKAIAAGRCLSGLEHGGAFEFLGAATTHANQVMVVTVGFTAELEAAPTFREFEFLQQPHGAQQPQAAVNGGQRYALLAPPQSLVHFFGAEVAAFTELLKEFQHPLPLGRQALSPIVQAAAQARPRRRRGGGRLGRWRWWGRQGAGGRGSQTREVCPESQEQTLLRG
jgi:hypothetical protein